MFEPFISTVNDHFPPYTSMTALELRFFVKISASLFAQKRIWLSMLLNCCLHPTVLPKNYTNVAVSHPIHIYIYIILLEIVPSYWCKNIPEVDHRD